MSLLEMEDKCWAQPREGNGHSMQINPTIISGNTKCNKYKYNNFPGNMKCKKYKYSSHQGKYKMRQIQIQQPSGEIRNATNTNTTIIRGNTKCNKYKYKQSSGEILAFHQVVVGKTKFYSFVHTHLNVSVEIKSTFLQVIPNKSPSYFAVIIASEA